MYWKRWTSRAMCIIGMVVLAAGCDNLTTPGGMQAPDAPARIVYCDEPDPNNPDCETLMSHDGEIEDGHMADGTGEPADPLLPLWNGQTADQFVDVGRAFCPMGWPTPVFRVRVILYNESAVFSIPTTAFLSRIVGRTASGYPIGAYATPAGYWKDETGKYSAYGGEIIGECHVVEGRSPTGHRTILGYIRSINFTGNVWVTDRTAGRSTSGRGWGYHQAWNGQTSTSIVGDTGAAAAVQLFLDAAVCTPGWEIWVDGVQECRADGTAV